MRGTIMNRKHYKTLLEILSEIHIKFPHVAVKLECCWGRKRCHEYLCHLLSKEKTRLGFPIETYELLNRLYLLHLQEYGDFGDPLVLFEPNVEKIV